MFVARYGTLDMPIAEYTAVHASHVEVIDLATRLPELFSILQPIASQ